LFDSRGANLPLLASPYKEEESRYPFALRLSSDGVQFFHGLGFSKGKSESIPLFEKEGLGEIFERDAMRSF